MADRLEHWRELFRGAGASIFEVIEHAIVVAASDCPQELRHQRDRIAEKLYTALAPAAAAAACSRGGVGTGDVEERNGSVPREAEKECKVGSSSCTPEAEEEDDERLCSAAASNFGCSYDQDNNQHEAGALEALSESQLVEEVLRIKKLLVNMEDQSESMLLESLRRLQLMHLPVETLESTKIGRTVNELRKHKCQEIRDLVHTLVENWKLSVDTWINARQTISVISPDSANLSDVDEEGGLPFPPMDNAFLATQTSDEAFLATQTTYIELSEFFDGMDEDGNLKNNNGGDLVRRQEPSIRPSMRQQKLPKSQVACSQSRPSSTLTGKALDAESRPVKPPKAVSKLKPDGEMKPNMVPLQRKSAVAHNDKSKISIEASVGDKLEEAKRKLHESYQEAENAKRQRTIQVMELTDIPKQSHQRKQRFVKSRNPICSSRRV